MFLMKQLKYLNLKEVRNFGTVLHQVNDLNRKGVNLLCTKSCLNTKITCHTGSETFFNILNHFYLINNYFPFVRLWNDCIEINCTEFYDN